MKCIALIFLATSLLAFSVFGQSDIGTLLEKSNDLSTQHKFPEAIGVLTEAIATQPANADLYLRRAKLYSFAEKYDLIAGDVKKAVNLKPDADVVLVGAGILNNANQCVAAQDILNAYIFKDQKNDSVFYTRALSKTCLDDPFGAFEDISKARDLAPNKVIYRTMQTDLLLKLGDSEKALARTEQLIKFLEAKLAKSKNEAEKQELKNDLSEAYGVRSNAFRQKGDMQAELADLARVIKYSPTFYHYQRRALIYANYQMYGEAIADYTEAIRLAEHKTSLLIERGEVYVLAEKYAEAVSDYEEALRSDEVVNRDLLDQRLSEIRQRMEESGIKPR